MSKRISTQNLVAWLKDRVRLTEFDNRPVYKLTYTSRVAPALFPDISIFGESLVSHRLRIPSGIKFDLWLYAYEEGLKETLAGKDPIGAISLCVGIAEKKLRPMLSAYRSHPMDEMAHAARVMAIAANRRYFPNTLNEEVVTIDGRATMGVEGYILSAYGNTIPLRDHTNYLYRPFTTYEKQLTPGWTAVYEKYGVDDDALRVLDVMLFSTNRGYEVLSYFAESTAATKAYYKAVDKSVNLTHEHLDKARSILDTSRRPVVDLHKMFVPKILRSTYFVRNIGNSLVQQGPLQNRTRARILAWIERQTHVIEQRQLMEQY